MKKAKRETKRQRKENAAMGGPAVFGGMPLDAAHLRKQIARIAADVARALAPKTKAAAIAAAQNAADSIDSEIANALLQTPERPACGIGCSYCCRGVRVDVSVPEIARIVDYLERHVDADVVARVDERARANAAHTHGKHVLQYPLRLPCALLGDDGGCLAYAVRPVTCRTEHSTDADECKKGHDLSRLGVDMPLPRIFELQIAGSIGVLGTAKGVKCGTGDAAPCELQEALHIALSTPDAVDRWLAGTDAFAAARVDENEGPPLFQLGTRASV